MKWIGLEERAIEGRPIDGVRGMVDGNGNPGFSLGLKRDLNSRIIFVDDPFDQADTTLKRSCEDRQAIFCLGNSVDSILERRIREYATRHFDSDRVLFVKTHISDAFSKKPVPIHIPAPILRNSFVHPPQ